MVIENIRSLQHRQRLAIQVNVFAEHLAGFSVLANQLAVEIIEENRRSANKRAWIADNIESVTTLILTILAIVVIVIVISDPSMTRYIKNPKSANYWNMD